MLTLVTASDTNFFLFLIRLVNNVINVSNKKKNRNSNNRI